jgi:hypothetical protein
VVLLVAQAVYGFNRCGLLTHPIHAHI